MLPRRYFNSLTLTRCEAGSRRETRAQVMPLRLPPYGCCGLSVLVVHFLPLQKSKKPKALTLGSKTHLLPVHTTMAQYQIYKKYMLISSFLQYLADNLLPFVVNVIAKHAVAPENRVPYTGGSSHRNVPRNSETSLFY